MLGRSTLVLACDEGHGVNKTGLAVFLGLLMLLFLCVGQQDLARPRGRWLQVLESTLHQRRAQKIRPAECPSANLHMKQSSQPLTNILTEQCNRNRSRRTAERLWAGLGGSSKPAWKLHSRSTRIGRRRRKQAIERVGAVAAVAAEVAEVAAVTVEIEVVSRSQKQ